MQMNVLQNDTEIPCLSTASNAPLSFLEKHLHDHFTAIEAWFRGQWQLTAPPFYCSVDLRNAGFKLAPVDTNLFPAGFNNLSADMLPLCIQAVQSTILELCPKISRILLVPENHTRNIFYLENVAVLYHVLTAAGFEVKIGSLIVEDAQKITLPSGRELLLESMQRQGNKVRIGDFVPCMVLLNNDLSGEIPTVLSGLEQLVLPPLSLGWANRLKSGHFKHYSDVVREFATAFNLDPWLLDPVFQYCGEVDFMKHEGEECLAHKAEAVLKEIAYKYKEYGIKEKPFVAVKADAGSYGMAVMMVQDPADIYHLNRKERTRMMATKGGNAVSKVIIQEGVYSFETWGEKKSVAEPVVYMMGRHVVGGFYRIHAERGINENLNAPGMNFEPLAFIKACNNPSSEIADCANRFYAYGVVARLALLAAARENV